MYIIPHSFVWFNGCGLPVIWFVPKLNQQRMDRIRKQLLEPEYSQSSYDTAWVAMVPKPGSPDMPCFPGSIEWILQNQQSNGSWGLGQVDYHVNKDVLSSTLACVLALKRWNVGSEHITRGIHASSFNIFSPYPRTGKSSIWSQPSIARR
jgi:hypothetical protein